MKRADHDLRDPAGRDCTALFRDALAAEGFVATVIEQVEIAPGERVPAWLVETGRARFGHIFWERFTAERARKLWGSVHKNAKGDWARMLGVRSRTPLYVHPDTREHVDPENPSGW